MIHPSQKCHAGAPWGALYVQDAGLNSVRPRVNEEDDRAAAGHPSGFAPAKCLRGLRVKSIGKGYRIDDCL